MNEKDFTNNETAYVNWLETAPEGYKEALDKLYHTIVE